jgi:mxaD protein
MKFTIMVLALGAALGSNATRADPPKTIRVTETVEIKAPIDKVWATVRDFDSLHKWHPGFASDELLSGGNGKVGAVRKLTIKDGPVLTEKLVAYDAAHHSYRYKILESPLPFTGYASTISVRTGPSGLTRVTWSGSCTRKNPADNPPEAESDAGVRKLVKGVYRGGLDNLKKMLEN